MKIYRDEKKKKKRTQSIQRMILFEEIFASVKRFRF